MTSRAILLALIAWLAAGTAMAQSGTLRRERERLNDVTSQMRSHEERSAALQEESRRLSADIEMLTRRMITTAARIQDTESAVSRADKQLVALKAELELKRQVLADRQGEVMHLLGVLQMLSRQPPELVMIKPSSALDTARTASLLSGILPALRARTIALRRTIVQLDQLRAKSQAERGRQQQRLARLAADQAKLVSLAADRAAKRESMLAEADQETQRLDQLASQARTLQELLTRLEAVDRLRNRLASLPGPRPRPARSAAPVIAQALPQAPRTRTQPAVQQRSFAAARGDILLPVRGDLVQSFGDDTPSGKARGILIRARSEAQIVAPYDGRVAFAGVFRNYGLLLIIAHGQGYHSLIAGFARIDGKVGDMVRAGEPVGVMSAAPGGNDLYLELRQGGQPINPLPWLMAGLRKTQG